MLLLVYYSWTGRLLKGAVKGGVLPSSRALRWFNELPLVLFIGVVWLVIAKPF
ncbi:CopD family protein [Dryocola clanedunensis]